MYTYHIDPLCSETVMELTNVLVHNNKLNEAAEALQHYLRHQVYLFCGYIHLFCGNTRFFC